MHVYCQTTTSSTRLILAEVQSELHSAASDLQFQPAAEGFAKEYPRDTSDMEHICRNLARDAESMLRQTARQIPIPWDEALLAFLHIVEGETFAWWLRGSAALAVRGLPLVPRDIDLTTDDAGAQRLGTLLHNYLVEPIVPVHGWFCTWWGRAFLQARIEWMGGVNETADQPEIGDFGPEAERRAETIVWHGYPIRVPPLALQRQVCLRRGLYERAALIREAMS